MASHSTKHSWLLSVDTFTELLFKVTTLRKVARKKERWSSRWRVEGGGWRRVEVCSVSVGTREGGDHHTTHRQFLRVPHHRQRRWFSVDCNRAQMQRRSHHARLPVLHPTHRRTIRVEPLVYRGTTCVASSPARQRGCPLRQSKCPAVVQTTKPTRGDYGCWAHTFSEAREPPYICHQLLCCFLKLHDIVFVLFDVRKHPNRLSLTRNDMNGIAQPARNSAGRHMHSTTHDETLRVDLALVSPGKLQELRELIHRVETPHRWP